LGRRGKAAGCGTQIDDFIASLILEARISSGTAASVPSITGFSAVTECTIVTARADVLVHTTLSWIAAVCCAGIGIITADVLVHTTNGRVTAVCRTGIVIVTGRTNVLADAAHNRIAAGGRAGVANGTVATDVLVHTTLSRIAAVCCAGITIGTVDGVTCTFSGTIAFIRPRREYGGSAEIPVLTLRTRRKGFALLHAGTFFTSGTPAIQAGICAEVTGVRYPDHALYAVAPRVATGIGTL
jgi:hypothetical protein